MTPRRRGDQDRGGERPGGTLRAAALTRGRKGEQLQEILEDLVAASEPGAQLPSERDLASRYGVARMTVRGVIDRLVSQGLVHRVQGQGTFVSEPRVVQPSTLTSFTEDMAVRDLRPTSIVLAQEVVPAPEYIAVRLETTPGEPIVRIARVRRGDDEPVAVERSHLPARRFPDLEQADLATGSLYRTLAEGYGCTLASSEQRIAAVRLSPTDAHLLHAEEGAPALRIERVTRDDDGAVVEFVRSVYRGDRLELHTEQHRLVGTSDNAAMGTGAEDPW